jgi:hypothetical protein
MFAGSTSGSAGDSKTLFDVELANIQNLLSEVRIAVELSSSFSLNEDDNTRVRTRGEEVKAVGEWCHQEGGEVRGFIPCSISTTQLHKVTTLFPGACNVK